MYSTTGGYQTVTPRQLAAVLGPYLEGELSLRAVRVFFAAIELTAIRAAARRSRPGKREKRCRYRPSEIEQLTGLGDAIVRRELRRLGRAGVLRFSESDVRVPEGAADRYPELVGDLSCGRSVVRPIPVPRPVLRFLARSGRKSVTLTMIGYLARGLSLDRRTGAVSGKGTLKLSWVEGVFGLSERAAKYARAELIRLRWISKDAGSVQRKLNRDGAYFQIDLVWGRGVAVVSRSALASGIVRVPAERSAPPASGKGARIAPPIRRPENYSVSKNQETSGAPERPAGVSTKWGSEQPGPPTLRDVKREDLEHFSRTEALYLQAVREGITRESEASFLNWMAAAVRAKSVSDAEPVRVFMGIVRRGLWHHVTQAEEDRARLAIKTYRHREASPVASAQNRSAPVASYGILSTTSDTRP